VRTGRIGEVLTRIDVRDQRGDLAGILPAPVVAGSTVGPVVAQIIERVRRDGDAAVAELTAQFDGVRGPLRVPPALIAERAAAISEELRHALEVAYRRIVSFHAHELHTAATWSDGGVIVEHRTVPVDRAGIYAPGGRARYPSSVLMAAGAARAASVKDLVLCSPAGPDGLLDDATLAAAHLAGIDEVYMIGGAQAIAAMAFGTETIAPVQVIAGPGNSYVAEAKRQVMGTVGVASGFAGPSEVAVVVDGSVDPRFAAIDLMVQAEHGPDGIAWLIGTSVEALDAVDDALATLVAGTPRSAEILATFDSGGYAVLVRDRDQAVAVADVVAAEHLELLVANATALARQVSNAGAIFTGAFGAAAIGDYVAGPSHILPTNRTARFASALLASDFVKRHHIIEITEAGFAELNGAVEVLATVEGLDAHAASVRMRR